MDARAASGEAPSREWSEWIADAGKIKHGCLLEATISRLSSNAVHLVTSLGYLQPDAPPAYGDRVDGNPSVVLSAGEGRGVTE